MDKPRIELKAGIVLLRLRPDVVWKVSQSIDQFTAPFILRSWFAARKGCGENMAVTRSGPSPGVVGKAAPVAGVPPGSLGREPSTIALARFGHLDPPTESSAIFTGHMTVHVMAYFFVEAPCLGS